MTDITGDVNEWCNLMRVLSRRGCLASPRPGCINIVVFLVVPSNKIRNSNTRITKQP